MSASILDYYPPVPGGYLVGTYDQTRKVTWFSPATRAVIAAGKGLAHLARTAASDVNWTVANWVCDSGEKGYAFTAVNRDGMPVKGIVCARTTPTRYSYITYR